MSCSPRDARVFLSYILKCSQEDLLKDPCPVLSAEQKKQLESWCQRREQGEPLSKIVGEREFWSLLFFVSPHTLDPRPESETLIQAVTQFYKDKNQPLQFLDLGTGSGCLLVTLLHEYPQAHGMGVDISLEALKVSQSNAKRHGVENRCHFIHGSWLEPVKPEHTWDVIVSNPPYIGTKEILPKDVLDFDPHEALFAGEDGLECYQTIFAELKGYEHQKTHCFFEVGYNQSQQIEDLLKSHSYSLIAWHKDLLGYQRVVEFKLSRS